MIRRFLLFTWLIVIFSGIAWIFWYYELQYLLPTPIPDGYQFVNRGTQVDISGKFAIAKDKPVFIHFFNPDCPCSRFNMAHFKSLVRMYGDKINFAIVVLNKDKHYTEKEIQDKYDLNIPVSFDRTIADMCGVYSTPQAVLIDIHHDLYYRGNYNRSRYCTDQKSNYAQMAIDSLLGNKPNLVLDESAFRAYGCQLPTCKR